MIRENKKLSRTKNNSGDLILFLAVVLITVLFLISSQIWS